MPKTRTRHHENEMVNAAVEHYAEALEARSDIDEDQKQRAIQAYTERMHQIWENPQRPANRRTSG